MPHKGTYGGKTGKALKKAKALGKRAHKPKPPKGKGNK